jgi:hypothetical protein
LSMGDLREGKNREISKDTRRRPLAIEIPAKPPSLDIKGKCLKSIFSFPDIIEIRHYRRMIQWIKNPTNVGSFRSLRQNKNNPPFQRPADLGCAVSKFLS